MDNNTIPGAAPAPTQPAPVTPTQVAQPVVPAQAPANVPGNSKNKKRKIFIIAGCSAAAVVAIVAVVLVMVLSKGGEKTVVCTSEQSSMGMELKNEATVKVKDEAVLDVTSVTTVDLKSMNSLYKTYEQQIVDQIIDSFSGTKYGNCNVTNDYVAGEYLKIILKTNGGLGCITSRTLDFKGKSAQVLADEIQRGLESSLTNATCKQQ